MRLSDFWERMETVIEPAYTRSWGSDVVLPRLNLTVDQAIASGIETNEIWRAVCEFIEVPSYLR